MLFAKLRIGPKMGLVFGFVLVMMLLIIYFGINGTSTVKKSMERLVAGEYQKTVYAFRAKDALNNLVISIQKLVMVSDPNQVQRLKKELEEARADYRENLKKLEELEKDPQGIKLRGFKVGSEGCCCCE